jgi:pyridoxine 5-phosphate synthase
MNQRIYLGVNLDHVATLRQVRGVDYPDFLTALKETEKAGADGITVHLREDRRHIQDSDVWLVKKKSKLPLNLEMSLAESIVKFAIRVKPPKVCLVPEKRAELTTEGGLDVVKEKKRLEGVVKRLQNCGAEVSLFIDPVKKQIQASYDVGAEVVELHTGTYANKKGSAQTAEIKRLKEASRFANSIGLIVNAGHGLTVSNVGKIKRIPHLHELNIGHAIVADAVFVGLRQAIRDMKSAIKL